MGKLLCNVLETVTISKYHEIALLKQKMLSFGAKGTLMSGSGSTVFGLFTEKQKAIEAERSIKKNLDYEMFLLQKFGIRNSKKGESTKWLTTNSTLVQMNIYH